MTKEYRTQMNPVRVRAVFCDTLSFSAGRFRSFNPAATRHHFIMGAQKKMVLGPAGWFMNAVNLEAPTDAAVPDILRGG